jgi:hypothetical protein
MSAEDDEAGRGSYRYPSAGRGVTNRFGITDVNDMLKGRIARYAVSWLGSLPNRKIWRRSFTLTVSARDCLDPYHSRRQRQAGPYSHGVRLHQALTKAGVRTTAIPGGGRGDFTDEQERRLGGGSHIPCSTALAK